VKSACRISEMILDICPTNWYNRPQQHHNLKGCEEEEYPPKRQHREPGTGASLACTSSENGPRSRRANPPKVARAGVATVIRAKGIGSLWLTRTPQSEAGLPFPVASPAGFFVKAA